MLSMAGMIALINGFNFTNILRVLQSMSPEDMAALHQNQKLSVSLYISHVASKDELRYLLVWLVHRAGDKANTWHYDVRFNVRLRSPRPASRYINGYHMKQDLVVTLIRRLVWMKPAVQSISGDMEEQDRLIADLEGYASVLEGLMNEPEQGGEATILQIPSR